MCDCKAPETCHANFLAAVADKEDESLITTANIRVDVTMPPWRAMRPKVRWPQAALELTFRKLFPREFTAGMKFPMLEDIVNAEPFTAFSELLGGLGLPVTDASRPLPLLDVSRHNRKLTGQIQANHVLRKGAINTSVSLGLEPLDHMDRALTAAENETFPLDQSELVELDARFAARCTALHLDNLRSFRSQRLRAMQELASRLDGAKQHLRKFQPWPVSVIAKDVHIALLAIAVILLEWPHTDLALEFTTGMSSIGMVPNTGIFRDRPQVRLPSADELLAGAQEAIQ